MVYDNYSLILIIIKRCPDYSHNKLHKIWANEITLVLIVILLHWFDTEDVPLDCWQGNIAHYLRKVASTTISISQFCLISARRACHHLNKRRHLEKKNIIRAKGHGFRSSCESQLFTFAKDLFNKVADCPQVDAFDIFSFERSSNMLYYFMVSHRLIPNSFLAFLRVRLLFASYFYLHIQITT